MKTDKDWCWYLVIDEDGNVEEAFNSEFGAEYCLEELGSGFIVKVKEDKT